MRIFGPKARPALVCGEHVAQGLPPIRLTISSREKAVLQHPWHELIDIDRIRQVPGRLVG
jgi:hypothetical protein